MTPESPGYDVQQRDNSHTASTCDARSAVPPLSNHLNGDNFTCDKIPASSDDPDGQFCFPLRKRRRIASITPLEPFALLPQSSPSPSAAPVISDKVTKDVSCESLNCPSTPTRSLEVAQSCPIAKDALSSVVPTPDSFESVVELDSPDRGSSTTLGLISPVSSLTEDGTTNQNISLQNGSINSHSPSHEYLSAEIKVPGDFPIAPLRDSLTLILDGLANLLVAMETHGISDEKIFIDAIMQRIRGMEPPSVCADADQATKVPLDKAASLNPGTFAKESLRQEPKGLNLCVNSTKISSIQSMYETVHENNRTRNGAAQLYATKHSNTVQSTPSLSVSEGTAHTRYELPRKRERDSANETEDISLSHTERSVVISASAPSGAAQSTSYDGNALHTTRRKALLRFSSPGETTGIISKESFGSEVDTSWIGEERRVDPRVGERDADLDVQLFPLYKDVERKLYRPPGAKDAIRASIYRGPPSQRCDADQVRSQLRKSVSFPKIGVVDAARSILPFASQVVRIPPKQEVSCLFTDPRDLLSSPDALPPDVRERVERRARAVTLRSFLFLHTAICQSIEDALAEKNGQTAGCAEVGDRSRYHRSASMTAEDGNKRV